MKSIIYSGLKTVEEAGSTIPEEKLENLVQALIEADTIVTAGSQASHAFASWFAFAGLKCFPIFEWILNFVFSLIIALLIGNQPEGKNIE